MGSWSRWKTNVQKNRYVKAFAVLSVLEALFVAGMELGGLIDYDAAKEKMDESVFIKYVVVFLAIVIAQLIFTWNLILTENYYHVIAFLVSIVAITLYAVYELIQYYKTSLRHIIFFVGVVVFDIGYLAVAPRVTWEYKDVMFKRSKNTTPDAQRIFQRWNLLTSLFSILALVWLVLWLSLFLFLQDPDKNYYHGLDVSLILIGFASLKIGLDGVRKKQRKKVVLVNILTLISTLVLVARIFSIFTYKIPMSLMVQPISVIVVTILLQGYVIYLLWMLQKDFALDNFTEYIRGKMPGDEESVNLMANKEDEAGKVVVEKNIWSSTNSTATAEQGTGNTKETETTTSVFSD